MSKKSKLCDAEKLEAILMLLRKEEPASVLARRYGWISNARRYSATSRIARRYSSEFPQP